MNNKTIEYFRKVIAYCGGISEREKFVLVQRLYGLTQKQIGFATKPIQEDSRIKKLGLADGRLSPERIRQMESKALSKIDRYRKFKKL